MSEMAIVSARKVRLQQQAEAGNEGAAAALALAEEPNRFLSTVQIGITLVGILAGAFGGATLSSGLAEALRDIPVIAPYANEIAFTLVVSVITYLSLVVGELVPKRLALQNAERIAAFVARPMLAISKVATPLVTLLGVSTDLVLRLLRIQPVDEPTITEEEVGILLRQGAQAGVFEHSEREMVMEIFRLGDRIVAEIMTPRVKIVTIDRNATPEEVFRIVTETDYTIFPVVDGSLDHLIGVVSVKDLWRASVIEGQFDLMSIVRQPLYVPETLPVLDLLEEFRRTREEIAFAVNEYGGVEGLVTLRDVVDEIVGELEDVHEEQAIVRREDGSWLVDGLVSLFDVDEALEIDTLEEWAEDRYQTLGGFVMGELGRVPQVADVLEWGGLRFEVVDMDGNRVDRILISRIQPAEPADARSI